MKTHGAEKDDITSQQLVTNNKSPPIRKVNCMNGNSNGYQSVPNVYTIHAGENNHLPSRALVV